MADGERERGRKVMRVEGRMKGRRERRRRRRREREREGKQTKDSDGLV